MVIPGLLYAREYGRCEEALTHPVILKPNCIRMSIVRANRGFPQIAVHYYPLLDLFTLFHFHRFHLFGTHQVIMAARANR